MSVELKARHQKWPEFSENDEVKGKRKCNETCLDIFEQYCGTMKRGPFVFRPFLCFWASQLCSNVFWSIMVTHWSDSIFSNEDVLIDFGRADESGYFDSPPMRTAAVVVLLNGVAFQTIISERTERKLLLFMKPQNLFSMACSNVKMRDPWALCQMRRAKPDSFCCVLVYEITEPRVMPGMDLWWWLSACKFDVSPVSSRFRKLKGSAKWQMYGKPARQTNLCHLQTRACGHCPSAVCAEVFPGVWDSLRQTTPWHSNERYSTKNGIVQSHRHGQHVYFLPLYKNFQAGLQNIGVFMFIREQSKGPIATTTSMTFLWCISTLQSFSLQSKMLKISLSGR